IESSAFDSHRNFWIDQLSGELPVLNLPGSGKRPKVRRFQGKCLSAYLDADTSKSLKSFCSDQGASIFMGLLASWHLLLYRYTQQRDIVIGSPVAAREHPDLEDQLGFYVNTLAFRNQLDPEQSFRTFLNQVKKNALLAYAHQMYPFDRLVEDLELVRNTGRNPIFDVVLTWVDQKDLEAPQDQEIIDTEEITIEGVATPKFDLDIDFHEVSNHLHFRVSYNEDVINETFAFQIVRQFRSLVQSILSNPDEAVARLDFITHQEKDQLLCVFNDTYSEFPHEKNIVDLIQDQVAKHPDRIALHFEGLEVTYNELDKISDQLSNFLRNQYNIQPETLIAVCLPRSEWLVIAILGIIKSGGAYVPIDPDYPSERIDYILNDSGSEILINEEMLTAFKASKKSADRQEKVVIHPSQLAYAIYTSGTTGKPKGTLVEHRNVVRLLKPEKTPFDFDQHDVWTLFHSYCFDFSVWEIFGALTHGAKLIIVPVETTRQPSKFLDLLLDQQVTVLNQTPSAFYQLSSATLEKKANPEQLKWVIFGGEKLFAEKLQDWQSSYPLVKLVNMYGITETTVHVTYNLLEQLELNTRNLNIGKPIPTTTCLILDEHQQLLPFGCEGELYVGGLGVTRGYLNRDE
ncbi:MAG: AMP-binding protein, partial [Ekhidna sp.]